MRKTLKSLSVIFIAFFVFVMTSCQSIIGYSVVLWNIPEYSIPDGTVVPVYIKSNISHVYVAGLPENKKKKIEIELWKLSEPQSKGKALKTAARYADYSGTYAKCVLDGLPIRADKVNTSKQVYRLRMDEIVRVLYEGKGVSPTNGKSSLDGKWLRVLTSDGTLGWCFSYNLRLFKMNSDGSYGDGAQEAQIAEPDELLEQMLVTRWYPDYYSSMISSGNIDFNSIGEEFGFDTGYTSGVVSIKLPVLSDEWKYNGTEKIDDTSYQFKDTRISVTVRSPKNIIVKYTDERGMPKSYNFISMAEDFDVNEIIKNEIEKRASLYSALRIAGPDFSSSNYGVLTFNEDNNFTWSGFSRLVPDVISRSARGSGKAYIQYFLSASLSKDWDGVITFVFSGQEDEVNFLYKKETNGLRLTQANVKKTVNDSNGRTTVSVSKVTDSLVMFFSN